MKRFTIIAAIAIIIASCAKTQFETIPQESLTVPATQKDVASFFTWTERCMTIPESRIFGIEVTYVDGTSERIPFKWKAKDITDDSECERAGTAAGQGQWYASGDIVSIVKLTSINAYSINGQKSKIEMQTIISHAQNNL